MEIGSTSGLLSGRCLWVGVGVDLEGSGLRNRPGVRDDWFILAQA